MTAPETKTPGAETKTAAAPATGPPEANSRERRPQAVPRHEEQRHGEVPRAPRDEGEGCCCTDRFDAPGSSDAEEAAAAAAAAASGNPHGCVPGAPDPRRRPARPGHRVHARRRVLAGGPAVARQGLRRGQRHGGRSRKGKIEAPGSFPSSLSESSPSCSGAPSHSGPDRPVLRGFRLMVDSAQGR